MKTPIVLTTALSLSLVLAPAARAGWTGDVRSFVGSATLSRNNISSDRTNLYNGIGLNVRQSNWPMSLAMNLSRSNSRMETFSLPFEQSVNHVTVSEIDVGATKSWTAGSRLRLSVSAGPAYLQGHFSKDTPSSAETAGDGHAGLWAAAGATIPLENHLNIGIEGHYSRARVSALGDRLDIGGRKISLTLGYDW